MRLEDPQRSLPPDTHRQLYTDPRHAFIRGIDARRNRIHLIRSQPVWKLFRNVALYP
jgi:hypothetical protein